MGFYAEPQGNKREWLNKVGKHTAQLFPVMKDEDRPLGWWPVSLLDFGAYQALGVSYNDRELSRFCGSNQHVYTCWVSKEELDKVMRPPFSKTLYTLKYNDDVEVQGEF